MFWEFKECGSISTCGILGESTRELRALLTQEYRNTNQNLELSLSRSSVKLDLLQVSQGW